MATTFFARTDNNTANNPALNLTGDPAVEITFVADGPSGDLFLETDAGGVDPDTLVEIGGVTYNFTFELTGTLPTTKKNGSQQVPDQYEGDTVVIITVQDYPTAGETTRFAFLPESGASETEMNAFGNGAIDIQGVNTTPPVMPVCFVSGTLIATPDGERPVETLRAGDRVMTASGKVEILRWVASSRFSFSDMLANPNVRPVCIPKGLLGKDLPHADLWVSPQHRIVLSGWEAELAVGAPSVLVPAKHLAAQPGLPGPSMPDGVDYYHLLLDRHEIVVSNGLASESLFPGGEALQSVGPTARHDLERHMRQGVPGAFAQTALPTLKPHEAGVFASYRGVDLQAA